MIATHIAELTPGGDNEVPGYDQQSLRGLRENNLTSLICTATFPDAGQGPGVVPNVSQNPMNSEDRGSYPRSGKCYVVMASFLVKQASSRNHNIMRPAALDASVTCAAARRCPRRSATAGAQRGQRAESSPGEGRPATEKQPPT